jgi:hypothetical protein
VEQYAILLNGSDGAGTFFSAVGGFYATSSTGGFFVV